MSHAIPHGQVRGFEAAVRLSTTYLVLVNLVLDADSDADDEPRDRQVLRSLLMLLVITLVMVGGVSLGLALLL